jgi:hypothetical protein
MLVAVTAVSFVIGQVSTGDIIVALLGSDQGAVG